MLSESADESISKIQNELSVKSVNPTANYVEGQNKFCKDCDQGLVQNDKNSSYAADMKQNSLSHTKNTCEVPQPQSLKRKSTEELSYKSKRHKHTDHDVDAEKLPLDNKLSPRSILCTGTKPFHAPKKRVSVAFKLAESPEHDVDKKETPDNTSDCKLVKGKSLKIPKESFSCSSQNIKKTCKSKRNSPDFEIVDNHPVVMMYDIFSDVKEGSTERESFHSNNGIPPTGHFNPVLRVILNKGESLNRLPLPERVASDCDAGFSIEELKGESALGVNKQTIAPKNIENVSKEKTGVISPNKEETKYVGQEDQPLILVKERKTKKQRAHSKTQRRDSKRGNQSQTTDESLFTAGHHARVSKKSGKSVSRSKAEKLPEPEQDVEVRNPVSAVVVHQEDSAVDIRLTSVTVNRKSNRDKSSSINPMSIESQASTSNQSHASGRVTSSSKSKKNLYEQARGIAEVEIFVPAKIVEHERLTSDFPSEVSEANKESSNVPVPGESQVSVNRQSRSSGRLALSKSKKKLNECERRVEELENFVPVKAVEHERQTSDFPNEVCKANKESSSVPLSGESQVPNSSKSHTSEKLTSLLKSKKKLNEQEHKVEEVGSFVPAKVVEQEKLTNDFLSEVPRTNAESSNAPLSAAPDEHNKLFQKDSSPNMKSSLAMECSINRKTTVSNEKTENLPRRRRNVQICYKEPTLNSKLRRC